MRPTDGMANMRRASANFETQLSQRPNQGHLVAFIEIGAIVTLAKLFLIADHIFHEPAETNAETFFHLVLFLRFFFHIITLFTAVSSSEQFAVR